jgi:hypothetical protein
MPAAKLRVTDGEPLAGHCVRERFAAGGAVKADAFENQGDSPGEAGAETLAGRAVELDTGCAGARSPEPWSSLLTIAPTA